MRGLSELLVLVIYSKSSSSVSSQDAGFGTLEECRENGLLRFMMLKIVVWGCCNSDVRMSVLIVWIANAEENRQLPVENVGQESTLYSP